VGAAVMVGLFGLYVVYELGRFNAGYDRLAAAQERTEAEVEIERMEKTNHELRTRLAELDMLRVGSSQERAELAHTIADLQAQVARQTQELAFYRGVVAQGDAAGLKIEQLRITASDQPDHFHVHLTIVQSVRPDDSTSGAVALKVEGESGGGPASLDFAKLTGGKQHAQAFSFRYYENFDQDIVVPAGFHPARLTVDVRSTRKGMAPLTQSFLWRVDAL
jgi:hypothetical protein